MNTGGNLYVTCPGTGQPVTTVTTAGSGMTRFRRGGWDGTGTCAHCGRDVSQRGGVAKRHKAP